MTNVKFKQVSTLPTTSEEGVVYFTSDGQLHLGDSNGGYVEYGKSSIEFVTSLPATGDTDKIYILSQYNTVETLIYQGSQWVSLWKSDENLTSQEIIDILGFTPVDSTILTQLQNNHNQHKVRKVTDENGAHGLKVDKEQNKIYVENEDGYFEELNLAVALLPTVKSFKSTNNDDDTATISWSNPTNTEFKRVQLYKSTQDISSLDLDDMNEPYIELVISGTDESYLHTGILGTTYYYKLFTIHDFLGEETIANPSILTVNIIDLIPPSVVTNVQIEALDGALKITWTNPPDQDLGNVRLNYSIGSINSIEDGIMAFNGTGNSVTIANLMNNTRYTLRFFTVDNNGNINSSEDMIYNAIPTEITTDDKLTNIGNLDLIAGDMSAGYFGTIPSSQLYTSTELAIITGVSSGSTQNENVDWLKFAIDGKIIFRPMKPIRYSITWTALNSSGCVNGEKIIQKNGVTFKVRLMKGALTNPATDVNGDSGAKNSEWNRLMLPIHVEAKDKTWTHPQYVEDNVPNWNIGFTDADLGVGSSYGNGYYVWTQNNHSNGIIIRGYAGISSLTFNSPSGVAAALGWVPVLEVVPPEELEGGN